MFSSVTRRTSDWQPVQIFFRHHIKEEGITCTVLRPPLYIVYFKNTIILYYFIIIFLSLTFVHNDTLCLEDIMCKYSFYCAWLGLAHPVNTPARQAGDNNAINNRLHTNKICTWYLQRTHALSTTNWPSPGSIPTSHDRTAAASAHPPTSWRGCRSLWWWSPRVLNHQVSALFIAWDYRMSTEMYCTSEKEQFTTYVLLGGKNDFNMWAK